MTEILDRAVGLLVFVGCDLVERSQRAGMGQSPMPALDLELHPDAVIHLFGRDSLVQSLDEPRALIDATIARMRAAG